MWEEGSDEVLKKAFAKTKADKLFWGEQTIERKNVQLNTIGHIIIFCQLKYTNLYQCVLSNKCNKYVQSDIAVHIKQFY